MSTFYKAIIRPWLRRRARKKILRRRAFRPYFRFLFKEWLPLAMGFFAKKEYWLGTYVILYVLVIFILMGGAFLIALPIFIKQFCLMYYPNLLEDLYKFFKRWF